MNAPRYRTLEEMIVATAEAVRPPERITVSEAAERYHMVKNPGQHEGPFSLEKTPYLREPMDVLTSLEFTGMVFAGPARLGKSAMVINWLCHTAITDPHDMMVVGMAQHTARDWSKADLAKAIRNSPELRKRMKGSRSDDNTYDKEFLSGMRLVVTWPTIKNLSGKTIPYQFIMDLDRIKPQIIDKEAHVFDATRKRGDTFKRFAMCAAEASPGFPVSDPQWIPNPASPHEAPPCEGILSLYNRGDRRRWFWECPHCNGKFEPHFKLLQWKPLPDIMDASETVQMYCPHCGSGILPNMQSTLNQTGKWIKEGQTWLEDGSVVGTPRRSDIASFWMFGPAAGFTDWPKLVHRYLTALETYEKTGDEGPLMTTVNVDQGDAYLPKALEGGRLPETLKSRAEDWGGHDENGVPYVPAALDDGGFLMATIDVQAGGRPSFVVHVFGISHGTDIWHVDMFKITKSTRLNDVGEREGLDPASYPEDWDVLIDQVFERSYPLPDGSGRRMGIKISACDSGGKDGVTRNAYDFYRRLRNSGKHTRFHLVKGSPSRTETASIRLTMPDSQQKDKFAIARGDVPVWLINSNIVKDQVGNMLDRTTPGRMVHFPAWAENWLYKQLTAEIRMPDGQWHNPSAKRNEALDLLSYCVAMCDHPDVKIRFLDWDKPPTWAAPWDRNDFVFKVGDDGSMAPVAKAPKPTLAELAARLS